MQITRVENDFLEMSTAEFSNNVSVERPREADLCR